MCEFEVQVLNFKVMKLECWVLLFSSFGICGLRDLQPKGVLTWRGIIYVCIGFYSFGFVIARLVWEFSFRVEGFGFQVRGFGFGSCGCKFSVSGFGFRV